MDMEEVQSLGQTSLRQIVLEADRDAAQFKAELYRGILSDLLAGEEGADPSRHHPQASGSLLIQGGAVVLPLLPAVRHTHMFSIFAPIWTSLLSWHHSLGGVEWPLSPLHRLSRWASSAAHYFRTN